MSSQHLTSWAIELESLGYYQAAAEVRARIAEAESVRRRIACVTVSAEEIYTLVRLGRAARDAEASGDWQRWAELLASCRAASWSAWARLDPA